MTAALEELREERAREVAALAELEQALTKNGLMRQSERAVLDLAVVWHSSLGTAAAQKLYEAVSEMLRVRALNA